ncbi:alpha/beta hydrolase family esterase [Actinokineospora sp. NPDC004072]
MLIRAALATLAVLAMTTPISSSAAPGCAPPGDHTEAAWPVVQHKPDGAPDPGGALVIDLHGAFSDKDEQDARSGMRAKADAEGFVVVQPDSAPHWTTAPEDEAARGVSDTEFLRRLIGIAVERLCVDPAAVYAVGFSSGGLMASQLACAGARGGLDGIRLAGIGLVAAAPLPDAAGRICPELAAHPVPMRLVFSHNDHVLAHCCGGDLAAMTAGMHLLAGGWAAANGCADDQVVTDTGQTGWGVVARTVHFRCSHPGAVVVDQLDTGSPDRDGHFWPGPPNGAAFDATAAFWSFFTA